jgi:hypothetical protein
MDSCCQEKLLTARSLRFSPLERTGVQVVRLYRLECAAGLCGVARALRPVTTQLRLPSPRATRRLKEMGPNSMIAPGVPGSESRSPRRLSEFSHVDLLKLLS